MICQTGVLFTPGSTKNCFSLIFHSVSGLLFTLFDAEVDLRLRADIRETLVSLLQALASENLSHWLSMCYQVLLASKAEEKSEASKKGKGNKSKGIRIILFSSSTV